MVALSTGVTTRGRIHGSLHLHSWETTWAAEASATLVQHMTNHLSLPMSLTRLHPGMDRQQSCVYMSCIFLHTEQS